MGSLWFFSPSCCCYWTVNPPLFLSPCSLGMEARTLCGGRKEHSQLAWDTDWFIYLNNKHSTYHECSDRGQFLNGMRLCVFTGAHPRWTKSLRVLFPCKEMTVWVTGCPTVCVCVCNAKDEDHTGCLLIAWGKSSAPCFLLPPLLSPHPCFPQSSHYSCSSWYSCL